MIAVDLPDLLDVALEATFQSPEGRDACPLCGYAIRADDDVVLTDLGEVCERHLVDVPEQCLAIGGPGRATEVRIGDQVVGTITFAPEGWAATPLRRDWRPSAAPLAYYRTMTEAAVACFTHTYPKES